MSIDDQEVSQTEEAGGEVETERGIERFLEDERFVPVIIKRNDETVRHPDDTLLRAIEEGAEQHRRAPLSLLLSSIAAGLILGFTAMSVALAHLVFGGDASSLELRFAVAFVYPLGFIICIMSGTQLFTEHTATAVYPVLDRQLSPLSLIRLWLVVLIGNLFGTILSSILLFAADPVIGARDGYLLIMEHLLHWESMEVFVSAILAGWLMAQGAWLVLATPPQLSQIISIYIVTFLIGLGGLHHSIAGSAEVFTGLLFAENPHLLDGLRFIAVAVIGNLVGGSVFVAILNYGHIRKTQ